MQPRDRWKDGNPVDLSDIGIRTASTQRGKDLVSASVRADRQEAHLFGFAASPGEPSLRFGAAHASRNTPASGSFSGNAAISVSALLHDARNMVSAMDLYCDLLEEPGVLTAPHRHFASELRLVGGACRRLLEKLVVADGWAGIQPPTPVAKSDLRAFSSPVSYSNHAQEKPGNSDPVHAVSERPATSYPESSMSDSSKANPNSLSRAGRRRILMDGQLVENLAEEVQANRNLLTALAGPAVTLEISFSGGQRPIAMTTDDLTRVLVNLVRNASEAMSGGGTIKIDLKEEGECLTLSVEDCGPGIPEDALQAIFSHGYSTHGSQRSSTHRAPTPDSSVWPRQHRGMGLSIVRSIVSAAGGVVWAANRLADPVAVSLASARDPSIAQDFTDSAAPLAGPVVHGAVILIQFPVANDPRNS